MYWGNVGRRALKETAELARLDNPGRAAMTLSVIIVPAGAMNLALGSADAWPRAIATIAAILFVAALIYLWKLLSIPPRIAREAEDERLRQMEKATSDLARSQEALAIATAPKVSARDYDGIYQHGVKVGRGVNPRKAIAGGSVYFDELIGFTDFAEDRNFDFQDLELELGTYSDLLRNRMGGETTTRYVEADCAIVGRKMSA